MIFNIKNVITYLLVFGYNTIINLICDFLSRRMHGNTVRTKSIGKNPNNVYNMILICLKEYRTVTEID